MDPMGSDHAGGINCFSLHGLLFQLFLLSLPPASTPAGRGPALPMRELRPSQSTVNSSEASPGAPKNSVENHG